MKKILNSNWFAVILIVVQVLCVLIGIYVAVNDSSHTSVALLFLVVACSFLLDIILMVCALVVKSTKRWLYIGITALWFLVVSPTLYEFILIGYMNSELDELEQERWEYDESEMDGDSIYLDSISN